MKKLTALFLSVLLTLALVSAAGADKLPVMQLHQINLGSADGYVIMVDDTVMLVDCGTNILYKHYPTVLMQYFKDIGLEHIDRYFVTHYHNDHALNIDVIMENFAVDDTVLYGPSKKLDPAFKTPERGHYEQLKDGDTFTFRDFEITCLGPERSDVTGNNNVDSLNFIVKYGDISILITGDYVQDSIVKRHADLLKTVDILKFPHHGLSPFVICQDALKLMQDECRIVLFPAYYPNGTQGYLNKAGLTNARRLYAKDGHIVILTDGEDLEVYTNVKPGTFAYGYDGGMGTHKNAEIIPGK